MTQYWQHLLDFTRSLRFRLTVWNTLVVFLAVIVALISVREVLRYSLLAETDASLNDEFKEIVNNIKEFQSDPERVKPILERKQEAHDDQGMSIRWMDADGEATIFESKSNQGTKIDTSAPRLIRQEVTYSIYESKQHRWIEGTVFEPDLPRYKIRVGKLKTFIEEDVERLTGILAPVGFVIFLLAPLGGLLLAERAVEPLQRLIRTTERLRANRMEERLELRGVGDELDQLAGKINAFLDEIANHIQKNREFVANAAHDLRSPLAAIQSSVDVTVEKQRTTEEYEETLFQINDDVHHLSQLVNQLLALAESESSASDISLEPVHLLEIATKTIEMFGPVAEEKGVKLKCESIGDVVALGHSQQLRQVLTNLVDNAIKFTLSGGTITVGLDQNGKPGFCRMTVADTGVGIPPESVDRVFDRFYQVEKSRQRFGVQRGNGLGLSICQSIITALGGTISVASEIGKGTTFTVQLPLANTQ